MQMLCPKPHRCAMPLSHCMCRQVRDCTQKDLRNLRHFAFSSFVFNSILTGTRSCTCCTSCQVFRLTGSRLRQPTEVAPLLSIERLQVDSSFWLNRRRSWQGSGVQGPDGSRGSWARRRWWVHCSCALTLARRLWGACKADSMTEDLGHPRLRM